MPRTVQIGDNSTACPQVTLLAVRPGESVTVVHNAQSIAQLASAGHPNIAAVPLTSGGSQTFTAQAWLTTTGRATFTVSGGIYGP
jgi:hypothetical protein